MLAADLDRQAMIATFLSEMEKGLAGQPSSLRMIPAYVGVDGKIPAGTKVAVLDAGGTNFRSAIVSIPPKIEERRNQPMPGSRSYVTEDEFYMAFAEENLGLMLLMNRGLTMLDSAFVNKRAYQ